MNEALYYVAYSPVMLFALCLYLTLEFTLSPIPYLLALITKIGKCFRPQTDHRMGCIVDMLCFLLFGFLIIWFNIIERLP